MSTELRKEQERLASRRWRQNHPERAKRVARIGAAKWRRENPELNTIMHIARTLKYRYGITPEQHAIKFASQNNLCGLCGKPFEDSNRGMKPALDHNHKTGKNRDFIHINCNAALGMLQDDPAMCRKAEEYLLRHTEET
jgi:hypothetical protein